MTKHRAFTLSLTCTIAVACSASASEAPTFDPVAASKALEGVHYASCGTGGKGALVVVFEPTGWLAESIEVSGGYDAATKACLANAFLLVHVPPFAPPRHAMRLAIDLPESTKGVSIAVPTEPSLSALEAKVPEPYDTPTTTPREEQPGHRRWEWYGWATLLVDAPGLALVFASGSLRDGPKPTGFVVGGVVMTAGTPAIHASQGNFGFAVLSLGMRASAFALIAHDEPCSGFFCINVSQLFGTGILLAAVALDAARFARVDRGLKSNRVAIAPALGPRLVGLTLSGEL